MARSIFHIFVLTLATILLTNTAASQSVPNDIRITFDKGQRAPDGKSVIEASDTELSAAVLRVPTLANDKDLILAAVFDRTITKDEVFRLKIDNRSASDA